jgi:putative ABC transport system permease protein
VLTPYTLTTGTAPEADGDLVVDRHFAERAHLEPGDRLTVQSTQSPRTYRITGIAQPAAAVRHQTSLFFSTSEARRLAAHAGQVTAFGVLPANGTDTAALKESVAKALRGTTAQVSAGDDRGPVEFLDAAAARTRLVSMGGAMGGTSLLVAVLVVVGTFALSVQQRHRELALLRAIAATPGQIRSLLGKEALIVGAAAGVTGALAGLPLGSWLHSRFVAMGAVPATPPFSTPSASSRCSPRSPRHSSAPGPPRVSRRAASPGSGRPRRSPKPGPSARVRHGDDSSPVSRCSRAGRSWSPCSACCAPSPPQPP